MILLDANGNPLPENLGLAKNGINVNPTSLGKFGIDMDALAKSAQQYSNSAGSAGNGGANVTQTSSFWYSPELTTESWLLPKSRQEILKWCRIFFNLEPYIQSIIMTHALYPFSKFDIITPDKTITQFYRDVAFQQKLDLYQLLITASLSYWKFGEAIFFMTMEQDDKEDPVSKRKLWRWKRAVLLEPELVEIKQEFFESDPTFEMIPTDDMKKLAVSNDPHAAERKEKVPPIILDSIKAGKNIPLSSESVSYIFRQTDPSANRGTPIIQCCFKALIYQDKIRLAQMAIADRYHFPIEMWTLGDLAQNILPTPTDLTNARNLINAALQSPPFSIVVPPILKYEALSVRDKLLPVKDDYDYLQDQIFVGLGVNRTLMTGEGPSFSNLKAISLQKLIMIYKAIRDQFENWMINYFFRPLAEKNEFYIMENGRKKLVLPQISWYKSLDIEEQNEERKDYKELHGKGYISTETLFSKFPTLDYNAEQVKLEREIGTIWDKGDRRLPRDLKDKQQQQKPGEEGKPPTPPKPGEGEESEAPAGGGGAPKPPTPPATAPGTSPTTAPTAPAPGATAPPATEVPAAVGV
jgi:hypothetical protein